MGVRVPHLPQDTENERTRLAHSVMTGLVRRLCRWKGKPSRSMGTRLEPGLGIASRAGSSPVPSAHGTSFTG